MAALVKRQLPNLFSALLPPHQTNTILPTGSAGLTISEIATLSDSVPSPSSTPPLTQAPSTEASSTSASSSAISSSTTLTPGTSTISSTSSTAPVEKTTSADGGTNYVTLYTTPSPSPSVQAAPANSSNGFLQNKTLSGIVFAIVGVVTLVILVTITTIALRRSRRRRLHNEAISFNPAFLGRSLDRDSDEKRRFSLLSSDHGHGGSFGGNYGSGYTPAAPACLHQDPFNSSASESHHNLIGHSTIGSSSNGVRADLHPGWMYGKEKLSIPCDRAKSPESAIYPQPGNLKITNV